MSGFSGFIGKGRNLQLVVDADEIDDYIIDCTRWLGADTIYDIETEQSGVSVSCSPNAEALTVTGGGAPRTIAVGQAAVVRLSNLVKGAEASVTLRIRAGSASGRLQEVAFRVAPH